MVFRQTATAMMPVWVTGNVYKKKFYGDDARIEVRSTTLESRKKSEPPVSTNELRYELRQRQT